MKAIMAAPCRTAVLQSAAEAGDSQTHWQIRSCPRERYGIAS